MTRMPGFVNYKRIPHLTRMEYRKWTLVLTPLDFPRSLSVAPRVPRRSTTLPRATCKAPLTQIANNAGVDGSVICEKVSEMDGNKGYNAATGEFEDLVKAGIIDPTKVTRTALQNSSSVSTLLLTSEALIAEKPKEDKKHGGGEGAEDLY